MSHGDDITISNFFVKGSKITEVKPFFHGLSSEHTMYIWKNLRM